MQKNRIAKFAAIAATATLSAAMIAVSAPAASAADHVIGTSGDTFTPSTLPGVVAIGDTITFNGLDGHNATSTAGSVAKFASPAGVASYKYTTTTAGKHTYDCTFHSGMVGSFTVAAAAGGAAPAPAAPAPAAPAPKADAPAAPAPAGPAPSTQGQVSEVPSGGIQTGGGSTAGFNNGGLVTLGGGLLMASFMSEIGRAHV